MRDPSCVIGSGHTHFLFVKSWIRSKGQQENFTLYRLLAHLHSCFVCMKRHKLLDCSEITKISFAGGRLENVSLELLAMSPGRPAGGCPPTLLHLPWCQLAGQSCCCCPGAPCAHTFCVAGHRAWGMTAGAKPTLSHTPLLHSRLRCGCQKSLLPPPI